MLFDDLVDFVNEKEKQIKPLIGKCFEYKKRHDSKSDTYVKVIGSTLTSVKVICFDLYPYSSREPSVSIETESLDSFHGMNEISFEEFKHKTQIIVDELGLKHVNDGSES